MNHPSHFNLRTMLSSVGMLSLAVSWAFAVSASANSVKTIEGKNAAASEVVNKLVAEDFEVVRANFTEQLKQGLSAETIKKVWRASIAHYGAYVSQGEPKNSQQDGYDVYVIRCEMKTSPMEVVVFYDQDGKIAGLLLRPASTN
jgi:Protein of unknown function (DUF3887)